MLSSIQNPKVKQFKKLQDKQNSSQLSFVIEGIHLVQEAFKAGLLENVIYCEKVLKGHEGKELLGKLISSDIDIEEVSESVVRYLSNVEVPQGIVAISKKKTDDMGSLFEGTDPLIVVACGIQDPGNLGTMIRTADGAAAAGLIVTAGAVDPYNDKVVRATAGSLFHLKIIKIDDIIDMIASLKRRGVKIVSTSAEAKKTYFDAELTGPIALLIGNEGRGLGVEVERLSDEVVSIPMPGSSESLNAAVSSAVIIYEALRQRRK
jgi:RNA methyltransferase, TrmH family